jgi:hypothetical protein
MDFLEQWFHISPDGGNGLLEMLYIGAAIAVLSALAFRGRLLRAPLGGRRSTHTDKCVASDRG